MRLVVDTNVLVSGSLWPGAAGRLVDAVLEGKAELCLSPDLLAEFADVLRREKFRPRLAQRGQTPEAIVGRFGQAARRVEPSPLSPPASLRDADDAHVLACAVAAAADAIVTGDNDLLVVGECQGIPIIQIGEALRRLGME